MSDFQGDLRLDLIALSMVRLHDAWDVLRFADACLGMADRASWDARPVDDWQAARDEFTDAYASLTDALRLAGVNVSPPTPETF